MDKKLLINSIELLGIFVLFMATLVLIITFYTAYSSPDKAVLVLINEYNEAKIEAWIVMPFIILSGIATIIIGIIKFNKDET